MSIRVMVQRRDHDGTLPGIDTWGAVTDLHYDAGDEMLTVYQSDGAGGIRRKVYACGQYATVYIASAGGDDTSVFPPDAERVSL